MFSSSKPLPMTNRACHFWLSVRLLVFHMCSSGSFAASEIIICKDEGLSGEQPFHLSLFSATPSLFLFQSFCLSFLSPSLTSHTHFMSPSASLSSHLIHFWFPFSPPYFPLPRLFCRSPFHHIYISYFSSSALLTISDSDADFHAFRPYGQRRL